MEHLRNVPAWLAPTGATAVLDARGDLAVDLGPAPVADPAEPLACARTVTARGAGRLAGTDVTVDRPVALRAPDGAEVLVEVDGHVLAFSPPGAPSTVVCATPSLLGAAPLDAPADIHPAPTVVHAGVWDLSLLPACDVTDLGFVTAAGHATRTLPADVHDALVDFTSDPGPAGAMVVHGVPVGELVPTPASPLDVPACGKDHVSEFALLTVARRLGHPVGYAPELGGRVVQDIVPTAGDAYRQVSTSSRTTLAWHTEAAFHPHRPRYLLLLCLRGDPGASTLLCSVRHLAHHLDAATQAVLRQPRFTTMVDESYLGSRPTRWGTPRPVLSGPRGAESLWFDADLMRGTDDGAQRALDALSAAVDEHQTSVTLAAGDLLVVDNATAVHGRSPFSPRFDGTDRWLQRSFVVSDLAPSAAERTGHVVDTWFLP